LSHTGVNSPGLAPYRLADLAQAAGLSVCGVRTAYASLMSSARPGCWPSTATAPDRSNATSPLWCRHPAHQPVGHPATPAPPQPGILPARPELRCRRIHKDGEACLGKPLCPDCYDCNAAVVWNAHAPELWRRTMIGLRRRLDRIAKAHGTEVKVSYAKVAEFQARGLVHFHALIRLDGHDPHDPYAIIAPPPCVIAQDLADIIRAVAASTWFATVGHPVKLDGWTITLGHAAAAGSHGSQIIPNGCASGLPRRTGAIYGQPLVPQAWRHTGVKSGQLTAVARRGSAG
jgi:hypothetical protein